MSFSEWIKLKMQEQKLTASDLARALDVEPSAISHWLHDRRGPDPQSKEDLPDILNCSLAEVLLIAHKRELQKLREKRGQK
tara:strand:+ start:141 stop:383 length:243 start_codon:yes stop_codon:yes gene_type:complete